MAMRKPTQKETWISVFMLGLPILATVLGVDYGQKNPPAPATETNIAIGDTRSDQDIKILCETVFNSGMNFHIEKSGRH